jgi:hypothetical protein
MTDVMPNYQLERQRLAVGIQEMTTSVMRADLRMAELDDEKVRLEENKIATRKTIADMKQQLSEMDKTHGPQA